MLIIHPKALLAILYNFNITLCQQGKNAIFISAKWAVTGELTV